MPAADPQPLPLTHLKGIGPKTVEKLARLEIHSVQDILFHLPLRYQDRTRLTPIGSLRPGDQSVIEGEVELVQVKQGRRRSLLVRLADGSGALFLRFFHFSPAQQHNLVPGARLRCFGEVRPGPASLEIIHPEYRRVQPGQIEAVEESLTPIYPTTEGMHQLSWRDLTDKALTLLDSGQLCLPEHLPQPIRQRFDLPSLGEALGFIHRPPPQTPLALLEGGDFPARRRLVLEELLAHQLSLRQLRQHQRSQLAPALAGDGRLCQGLLAGLAFSLTGAQRRVSSEIGRDLAQPVPMLRLVQGDVGSGKTLVAALAALQAVEAGAQAALMAPTELLAEQHQRNLSGWLGPLGVRVGYLSSRAKGAERKERLAALASGELQLIIGTHALFQQEVRFHALGLVIVDEQHRFGVHQRLALHEKGSGDGRVPHQLVMTATPIPRTLAMTAYADLDISVIDELPPGRTPVNTVALPDSRRAEVIQRVERACMNGRQAYWVCTLIEESEALQCQAAEQTAAELSEALSDLRIGLVHGRLKPSEKEAMMLAFKNAELDLLVATTVIEVGVDVPNASLMIIENPERLGLAQLHQLRGRVGRGSVESHCLLLYKAPLSENARARLEVMRETNDGFHIARRDLELRGPGEVLGSRQTGAVRMRIADLVQDDALVPQAQQLADELLREHPQAAQPLIARWVGQRLDYGRV
ncbi:MAG: ATP-dependent DNA helicase RecG [Gammaproteobacteria bacterium SHHR-1]|uniref:ATP-dependent DNA helicase RecG n=1 Tax=Magnetovirga frankeli TaxID=947516 RepID=UPI001293CBF6|nr:ATP-dependent DNA helicase RecG [gamma proteobacterium SS-5]